MKFKFNYGHHCFIIQTFGMSEALDFDFEFFAKIFGFDAARGKCMSREGCINSNTLVFLDEECKQISGGALLYTGLYKAW